MLLDKEGRDKAEFVLGLNVLDSYRDVIPRMKNNFVIMSVSWLIISFVSLIYLSMDYTGLGLFISAMCLIWLVNWYNHKGSIRAIEGLIDFADKQEAEIESSLSP